MKIYEIIAADHGYDEYDSFVVIAENKKEALRILFKEKTRASEKAKELLVENCMSKIHDHIDFLNSELKFDQLGNFISSVTVNEVKLEGEPRIISESFNAG